MTTATTSSTGNDLRIREDVYWGVIIVYIAILVITNISAIFFGGEPKEAFSLTWSTGGFVFLGSLAHFILSLGTKQVDEHVGLTFFGMPVLEKKEAGPFLAPLGILRVWRITRNIIQIQFPGEPEQIEWRDEKEVLGLLIDGKLPEGKVWPIRITTGPADKDRGKEERDDPFNVQMTLSVSFYVRYRIENFFVFLQTIGLEIGHDPLARLKQQTRDTGERLLWSEFSSRSFCKILSEIKSISESLNIDLEEKTRNWGIKFEEAGVIMPSAGHEFNKSVREIGEKKAKAQQTRIEADATRYKLAEEGRGRGDGAEGEISGKIRGYATAKDVPGLDAGTIVAAEVATNFAKEGTTYFGDLSGIAGMVGMAKKGLEGATGVGNIPAKAAIEAGQGVVEEGKV